MQSDEQLKELCAAMHTLWWMLTSGHLRELRAMMRKLRRMQSDGQLKELCVVMHRLWRM
jgi:hypothetical protein